MKRHFGVDLWSCVDAHLAREHREGQMLKMTTSDVVIVLNGFEGQAPVTHLNL